MQVIFYLIGAGIAILSTLRGVTMNSQISFTTWIFSYTLIGLIIAYAIVGIILERRRKKELGESKDKIEHLTVSVNELKSEIGQFINQLPEQTMDAETMNKAQKLIKLINEIEGGLP